MQEDRRISEAIRHLEDLRAAGYITSEQFTEEVRGLLADLGMDADEAAQAAQAAAEGDADDAPLESIYGFELEDFGTPPEPDPSLPPEDMPEGEEPRPRQPGEPPDHGPRVTIKGAVPWEKREQAAGERMEEEPHPEQKQRDDRHLHHRQLADLASRDLTRLQSKRRPGVVALASLLVPGLGQFMLDRPGLGAGFGLVYVVGLVFILGFGELDALYVLIPTALLAGAVAHKHALLHNYHLERRRLLALRREEGKEARLNVERSVREGEWERLDREMHRDDRGGRGR